MGPGLPCTHAAFGSPLRQPNSAPCQAAVAGAHTPPASFVFPLPSPPTPVSALAPILPPPSHLQSTQYFPVTPSTLCDVARCSDVAAPWGREGAGREGEGLDVHVIGSVRYGLFKNKCG